MTYIDGPIHRQPRILNEKCGYHLSSLMTPESYQPNRRAQRSDTGKNMLAEDAVYYRVIGEG